jgi:excisionase family DNA binding protein
VAEQKSWRVRELMQILNVSREAVLRLLARGELQGFKIGRDWPVTQEELDRFRSQRAEVRHPRAVESDPLAPVNEAIAQEGLCTAAASQDQLTREAEGRQFYPPLPPE